MVIFSALLGYLGEIERRRRFYRTRRLLHTMPPEMLKDIGWPGAADGLHDICRRARTRRG